VSAATPALNTSDTMARKPQPSTSANATRRTRTKAPSTEACGRTWPMALNARRSSANTPVAPTSSVATPSSAAHQPWRVCQADATMAWMACAASGPTSPSIWPTTWPRAASTPNTSPAMAMVTTSSGASANIV
jgi:hypothetical protein